MSLWNTNKQEAQGPHLDHHGACLGPWRSEEQAARGISCIFSHEVLLKRQVER